MFRIETRTRTAGGVQQAVYALSNDDGTVLAELWPGLGCNCLVWRVPGPAGPLELLYVAPDWDSNPVPTHSGNPILFPFPNRIRDGHFVWQGREYQLPINGPNDKHAIHGFVCRRPWRVLREEAKEDTAIVRAEFQASRDSPGELAFWPTDYKLTVSVRLTQDSLIVQAKVENPDKKPLPYGLGYHPYFAVPFTPGGDAANCLVSVPARAMWELADHLPTGKHLPVPRLRAIRTPRRFAELNLDVIYTDLDPSNGPFQLRGRIEQPGVGAVEIWTWASFRDLVVFTPPHRQAICLEPYTCVTDAINLEAQGIDTGLRLLQPGHAYTEIIEYRFIPATS